MPVFLRWLLVDLIVRRILRHRRVRPYVDRAYPMVADYATRFGRRVPPTVAGRYEDVRRRRGCSCLPGCLTMSLMAALSLGALVLLVNWVL